MHADAQALVDGWSDGSVHDVLADATRCTVCTVARTLFGSDGSAQAEQAALGRGREFIRATLEAVLGQQAAGAEKKGRPDGPAPAGATAPTKAPPGARS
jgi:hypothetical protein